MMTLESQYAKAEVNSRNWNYDNIPQQIRSLKNYIITLQNLVSSIEEKGDLLTSDGTMPYILGVDCDPDSDLPSTGVLETNFDSLRISLPDEFIYDGLVSVVDGDLNDLYAGLLDGVTYYRSDSILLTDQDNRIDNGLYVVYDLGDVGNPTILVRPTELLEKGRLITEFDGTLGIIPSTPLVGYIANGNGDFNIVNFSGLEDRNYNRMDKILLVEQSIPAENIYYYVYDLGDAGSPAILIPVPQVDYDSLSFINGTVVGIERGDIRAGSKWEILIDDPFTLNSDRINVKLYCKDKALTTDILAEPDELVWRALDHITDISNVGTNTHRQIDEHMDNIIDGSKGTLVIGSEYEDEDPSAIQLPPTPNGQVLLSNQEPSGLRWLAIPTETSTDAKGDLLSYDGVLEITPAIGELDQVLTADSTIPSGMRWIDPVFPDLLFSQKGELLTYDGSGHAILPPGNSGEYLIADSGESLGIRWGPKSVPVGDDGNPFIDKGDIMSRTDDGNGPAGTDGSLISLPVGPDNYVLTADSSTPSGLAWKNLFGIRPLVSIYRKTSNQAAFNYSFPPGTDLLSIPQPLKSAGIKFTESATYQRLKNFENTGIDELNDTKLNEGIENGAFTPSVPGIYNIQVTVKWNPPSVFSSTALLLAPPCVAHEMHVQWSEWDLNAITYQILKPSPPITIDQFFNWPVIGGILQDLANELLFLPLTDNIMFTEESINAERTISEAAGLTPSNAFGMTATVTLHSTVRVTQDMIDNDFAHYLRVFAKIDAYSGDIDLTSSVPLPQIPGLPFHWADVQGSKSPSTDPFTQIIITKMNLE
jgi:hypothetical protein